MTTDLLLAIAHHLLIFALVAVLAAETVLVRPGLTGNALARLGGLDRAYGILAGLIIIVGFSRVFFGLKGWEFYIDYWVFWAKLAAFAGVGLLSIRPTMRILEWSRKATIECRPYRAGQRDRLGADLAASRGRGVCPDPGLRCSDGARHRLLSCVGDWCDLHQRSWHGVGLHRSLAKIGDDATPAFRHPRLADIAAVQDQPVMGVAQILVRYDAKQFGLDLFRRLARGQTQTVPNAEYVRIDGHGRLAESHVEHHIGRLSPDARQFDQRLAITRHFAIVVTDQSLRQSDDIFRLGAPKADRADVLAQLFLAQRNHVLRSCEQP